MAAKGSRAFVAAALIMCLLVAAASHAAAAITCGQVAGGVASCYKYLQGLGPPPPPCCAGVQKLNAVAQTPEDRQAACNCLKDLAGRVHGLKPDLTLQLPGKCGVSVPYPISTTTDCSKIH